MSFADILTQLVKKKKTFELNNPTTEGSERPPAEVQPSRRETPPATADAYEAKPESIDEAIELFESIREIVGDDDEFVRVPLKALFPALPADMRGPNWDESAISDDRMMNLEAHPLLEKLQTGRIVYRFKDISNDLPDGLIIAEPNDLLTLDLATVYASVPKKLLDISSRISSAMEQILSMPDYFTPKAETRSDQEAEPASEQSPGQSAEHHPAESATEDKAAEQIVQNVDPEPLTEAPAPAEPELKEAPMEFAPEQPEPAIDEPAAIRDTGFTTGQPEPEPAVDEPAATPATDKGESEDKSEQSGDISTDRVIRRSEMPAAEGSRFSEPTPTDAEQPARTVVLKPARHESRFPGGWDGCEQPSAAVSPTNVNTASPGEMVRLPGLGAKRAEAIMRYREIHGDLESVYDLLSIPGIGKKNFRDLTGLDPDKREDRSLLIKGLLDIPINSRPLLSDIANAIAKKFRADGCALVGADGIIISKSENMPLDQAEECGALAPKIFRGTKKYLARIDGIQPHMFALPGSKPPLLFVGLQHLYMVLALHRRENLSSITEDVAVLAAELDWLFSSRAIVGK